MARHFNTAGPCRPDKHYMILPPGVPTVQIGSVPATVQCSMCTCRFSAPAAIVSGSTTVQIGG